MVASAGLTASPVELREVARYRVIYGDTDQMGFVYYGNYLRYFEIARNEFLRQAGARYRAFEETHGLMLPVVEAHVRYRRPGALRRRAGDLRRDHRRCAARRRASSTRSAACPTASSWSTGTRCTPASTREGRVARIPTELRAALGQSKGSRTAALRAAAANGSVEPPPPLRARGT